MMNNLKNSYDIKDYYKFNKDKIDFQSYVSKTEIKLPRKQTAKSLLKLREFYYIKKDEKAVTLLNYLIGNTNYHKKIVFTCDGSYRTNRICFNFDDINVCTFPKINCNFIILSSISCSSITLFCNKYRYKYHNCNSFIKYLKHILNNYEKVFIQIPYKNFHNIKNGLEILETSLKYFNCDSDDFYKFAKKQLEPIQTYLKEVRKS